MVDVVSIGEQAAPQNLTERRNHAHVKSQLNRYESAYEDRAKPVVPNYMKRVSKGSGSSYVVGRNEVVVPKNLPTHRQR